MLKERGGHIALSLSWFRPFAFILCWWSEGMLIENLSYWSIPKTTTLSENNFAFRLDRKIFDLCWKLLFCWYQRYYLIIKTLTSYYLYRRKAKPTQMKRMIMMTKKKKNGYGRPLHWLIMCCSEDIEELNLEKYVQVLFYNWNLIFNKTTILV